MPQEHNTLRYTTYANPRVRRNSAGFLVSEVDLDVNPPPVAATLQSSLAVYSSYSEVPFSIKLALFKENGYTGKVVIQIGTLVGQNFSVFWNSEPIEWSGEKTFDLKPADIGIFDIPLELHYRIDPVEGGFSSFEDKLTSYNSGVASLVINKGLVSGTDLQKVNPLYSIDIEDGLMTPNVGTVQFGGNGDDRTVYAISEFFSPDSLALGKPNSGNAYITVKTKYTEDCGGVGEKYPPVVALLPVGSSISNDSFSRAIYPELAQLLDPGYGTWVYKIPDGFLSRGKITVAVMDSITSSLEYLSTEVTDVTLTVSQSRPTSSSEKIKSVLIDCSNLPLNNTSTVTLDVTLPANAGPVRKKTYIISSRYKIATFPLWKNYSGTFSYKISDDQGRVVDRRTITISGTDNNAILVDASNYLYSSLTFQLLSSGSVKTTQERSPWSYSFDVTITETNKVSFYPYEIGVKVTSSPAGTQVSIIPDPVKRNTYSVTVTNPSSSPLPSSSTPIVLTPYRMSGMKRGDVEYFISRTIPCSIIQITQPPVPVFTPVPDGTDMREIVAGIWKSETVLGVTQIIGDNGKWSANVLNSTEQAQLGKKDDKIYALGLTIMAGRFPAKKNQYRIDYKFLNSINPSVDYYIRSNYSYEASVGMLLSPNNVPYNEFSPWFIPSSPKGGWTELGISSSIGQTSMQGFESTNIKLVKLNDVLSGPVEFLIFPQQTSQYTQAWDFRFFTRQS